MLEFKFDTWTKTLNTSYPINASCYAPPGQTFQITPHFKVHYLTAIMHLSKKLDMWAGKLSAGTWWQLQFYDWKKKDQCGVLYGLNGSYSLIFFRWKAKKVKCWQHLACRWMYIWRYGSMQGILKILMFLRHFWLFPKHSFKYSMFLCFVSVSLGLFMWVCTVYERPKPQLQWHHS